MQMYGMTGEPLGKIGQEPETSTLPAWKQEFLSKPSVSIRKGIAWSFSQAYEDTSTLVLTSPSNTFVDIRFPLSTNSPSQAVTHPSFWAFSGTAHTAFYDAQPGNKHNVDLPYTGHCKFLHDIDSRGPGIVDQGDMFILPNGDNIEMGIMENPTTGQKELYKEYWVSAPPLTSKEGVADGKSCIVARTFSPADVEGVLIRIGGWIQGIVSTRTGARMQVVQVERWVRGDYEDGKPVKDRSLGPRDEGWKRDTRSGVSLPCAWLCDGDSQVGDNLRYNEILWGITEVHR